MKFRFFAISLAAVLASVLTLAGCQATPARVELQRMNVPLPVACDEPVPERPVMPTEQLQPGATVDQFIQAAQAEIERREAYEIKLAVALNNCLDPIYLNRLVVDDNYD